MARYVTQDRIPLSCIDLPDGSMIATGTLASVGVMRYPWGLEAVGDDCLSDPEWLGTAHAPIVLHHPPGKGEERLLTPERIAKYSDPSYDGPGKVIPGSVRVWWDDGQRADKIEVRVWDAAIQEGIRRGMYDLSPGYITTQVDDVPGELDGTPYNSRQRKRVGNHIALILAKEYGGRGGRGAEARFDAGEPGREDGMNEEQVKALIAEAIAAFRAEDEAKDKEMLAQAIAAMKEGMGVNGDMASRLDACEKAMARYDAAFAAKDKAEAATDTSRADATGKPAEDEKKAEDEARMDADDEANVLRLAASRGLDGSQPVATLRGLLLAGTGYEARPRQLQRIYVGELAKHVRTDSADPFGFLPPPIVPGAGKPRNLIDFSDRLAQRTK